MATNWKQLFVSLAVNEQENQNLSAFNKATSSDSSAEQRLRNIFEDQEYLIFEADA